MQGLMRYLGPGILVVVGMILFYFVDVDLPLAVTQFLALVLILAGLVWGALKVLRQVGALGHTHRSEEERHEDH
jgi:F0F1-type ATP synthase assembly protein I